LIYLILGIALLLFTLYLGYGLFLMSQAPPDPVVLPDQSAIKNAAIAPMEVIRELPIEDIGEYMTFIYLGVAGLSLVLAVVFIGYALESSYR
jgi:hypothetical protein